MCTNACAREKLLITARHNASNEERKRHDERHGHLFGFEATGAGRPLMAYCHHQHHEPKVQEANQQEHEIRGVHAKQVFQRRLPSVAAAAARVVVGATHALALETPRVVAHQRACAHLGKRNNR